MKGPYVPLDMNINNQCVNESGDIICQTAVNQEQIAVAQIPPAKTNASVLVPPKTSSTTVPKKVEGLARCCFVLTIGFISRITVGDLFKIDSLIYEI